MKLVCESELSMYPWPLWWRRISWVDSEGPWEDWDAAWEQIQPVIARLGPHGACVNWDLERIKDKLMQGEHFSLLRFHLALYFQYDWMRGPRFKIGPHPYNCCWYPDGAFAAMEEACIEVFGQ